MARIQYRPSAQRRGFRTQQLSTEGISRMREESNRLIQGMERQRRAEAEQRERERIAMVEDQAYTERITKENNAIELRNLKIEAETEVGIIQAQQKQSQINSQAAQSILTDIAQFSTTASEFLAKQDAARRKEEVDRINALPLPAIGDEDLGQFDAIREARRTQTDASIVQGANIIENGVLTNEPVHETLKSLVSNPGYTGRQEQAYVNRRASQVFNALLDRAKLSNEKVFTSVDGKKFSGMEAAANPELVDDMFAALSQQLISVFGRDAYYLKDTFEKVNATAKAFKGQADTEAFKRAKALGDRQVEDLYLTGDAENIVMAFAHDRGINGIAAALDNWDKQQQNPNIPIEAFAQADLKGNGKTYAQDQPKRYAVNLRKRDAAIVKQIEAEDAYKKAEDKAWVNANIDSIITAYNENPAQAAMLVKQRYHSKGMTVPTVIANIEREAIKKNKDIVENLVVQKTKFGNLDLTFVNSIQDATLQKTARAAYEQQELNKYGPEALGIKKQIGAVAKKRTGFDPSAEGNSPTTFLLTAAITKRYDDHLKMLKDPLAAWQKTQEDIEKDRTDPSGTFFEDVKGAVNNKPLFPNIETSPRERVEMNTYIDKELLLRGRSLVDKPFALANQYEMDAAYTSSFSGIVQYPPGIIRYADSTGVKPSEAFNAQRQANNATTGVNKPLLTPSPVTDLIDGAPPAMRKLFMSDVDAQVRRGGAMLTGQRPQRSSMGGSNPTPRHAYDYMRSLGVSDIHAKGILANIAGESNFQTDVMGDNGMSGGLFQMYNDRYRKMERAVPDWRTNWRGQIEHALKDDTAPQYLQMRFNSPEEAADWFLENYERPAMEHRPGRRELNRTFIPNLGF